MASPLVDDYYALLGVHAGADDEMLRRAWRQLALRYHPDRAGDGAAGTFKQLAAAYAVLSDPVARAAYDRRRRRAGTIAPGSAAATSMATNSPSPSTPRRSAPAVMLDRLCGSIVTLLATGAARFDDNDDDHPELITLVLSTAEAAQGGMVTISMRVEMWCPNCAPNGVAAQAQTARCSRCGGTRKVEDLFSAWLAVPPGAAAGEVLIPSAELPGMIEPVRFRVAIAGT
jgi:molecular chaperone DnaJ